MTVQGLGGRSVATGAGNLVLGDVGFYQIRVEPISQSEVSRSSPLRSFKTPV